MLTAQKLAKILDEEFERDSWGDIDPYWFKEVVEPVEDSDHAKDAEALREVLERVAARLNTGE